MDTSKFAPGVAGLGALQQQAQQLAATQAGLGTLQFDPNTGAVSGVQGTGVAGYQPYLQAAAEVHMTQDSSSLSSNLNHLINLQ